MRLMLNGYSHYGEIVTPGEIRDALESLRTKIMTFDREVRAFTAADASFSSGWAQYVQSFQKLYDDNQGWWSRLASSATSSTMDEIDNYQRQLISWQASFAKIGGKQTTPAAAPPGMSLVDKFTGGTTGVEKTTATDAFAGLTKALPWLAGGIALVYLGPPVVRGVQSLISSRRRK